MTRWDIDRELKPLEPGSCPGTTITRALVETKLLTDPSTKGRYGNIVPTSAELERGHMHLWTVALGYSYEAKAFFYGRTIRGAFLQARRAAKLGALANFTPWGRQKFTPSLKGLG